MKVKEGDKAPFFKLLNQEEKEDVQKKSVEKEDVQRKSVEDVGSSLFPVRFFK